MAIVDSNIIIYAAKFENVQSTINTPHKHPEEKLALNKTVNKL